MGIYWKEWRTEQLSSVWKSPLYHHENDFFFFSYGSFDANSTEVFNEASIRSSITFTSLANWRAILGNTDTADDPLLMKNDEGPQMIHVSEICITFCIVSLEDLLSQATQNKTPG